MTANLPLSTRVPPRVKHSVCDRVRVTPLSPAVRERTYPVRLLVHLTIGYGTNYREFTAGQIAELPFGEAIIWAANGWAGPV